MSRVFRVTAGAGAEGEKESEMHVRATYLDRHLQPVFPSTLMVEASCTAPTHLPQVQPTFTLENVCLFLIIYKLVIGLIFTNLF